MTTPTPVFIHIPDEKMWSDEQVNKFCSLPWTLLKESLQVKRLRNFIFLVVDDQVVAGCSYVSKSYYDSKCIGVSVIEVLKKHQGKGYSKLLINELFKAAQELGKGVRMTAFTVQGHVCLKENLLKKAKEQYDTFNLPYMEDTTTVFPSTL